MELSLTNYSGQPFLLFTSDKYYDKEYITKTMPGIGSLLGSISSQGWLSAIDTGVYADKIDQLVSTATNALRPQLLFQDFVLAGDVTFLTNIFTPPAYMYFIGLAFQGKKMSLSFTIYATAELIGRYINADDLLSRVGIFVGADSQFYCDDVTVDGQAVCQKPLSRSARFLNDIYTARHNPNMQSSNKLRNPEIASTIPGQGIQGQSAVIYLYLNPQDTLAAETQPVDTYNLAAESPNVWASIALLMLVLLIIAIVIGALLYIGKKANINIFNGQAEEQPRIMI